jgi:predicted DNA-binding protein
METKIITIREMPVALWRRLKAQAAVEGKTLQEVIADAIERYLDAAA